MYRFAFLMVMLSAACGDTGAEAECTVGEYQCDGSMLQECVADDAAVWEDVEDCAAKSMMCHAEMGHCMAEDM